MKCFFVVALFLPAFCSAQVSHSIGIGAYFNYSKPVNVDNGIADTIPVNFDVTGRVNVSPFVEYTFASGRFNASAGLGYWQNANYSSYSISFFGFSISNETTTKDRSVFVPLAAGYDVVQGEHLTIGARAKVHFRYLMSVTGEGTSNTPFGTFSGSSTFSGSELVDSLKATRFFISPGLGVYAGYEIGRIMPLLEVGALYDLEGANTTNSDKNKYMNLYAAVTVRYRLIGERAGASR